jgi:hypothetical protein
MRDSCLTDCEATDGVGVKPKMTVDAAANALLAEKK